MKLENLHSEIQTYLNKIKTTLSKISPYLSSLKAKINVILHKINRYIKDDYGVDLSKSGEVITKITRSRVFIIIMTIIILPPMSILFAGSLMVMAIWSIYLFAIYLCLVIMALLYILCRDYLDEKYQII